VGSKNIKKTNLFKTIDLLNKRCDSLKGYRLSLVEVTSSNVEDGNTKEKRSIFTRKRWAHHDVWRYTFGCEYEVDSTAKNVDNKRL
jgi:hypothetical protein